MVRLKNCVSLLSSQRILLYDTTIMHAYDVSLERKYEVNTYDLLTLSLSLQQVLILQAKDLSKNDILLEIAKEVRSRIARDEGR